MKKMISAVLCLLLLVTPLCACAGKTVSPATSVCAEEETLQALQPMTAERQPTTLTYVPWATRNIQPDGKALYSTVYKMDSIEKGRLLMQRYDFATQKSSYLCSKEGCAHQDETCQAYRKNTNLMIFMLPQGLLELEMKQAQNEEAPVLRMTSYETGVSTVVELGSLPFVEFDYNEVAMWGTSGIATDGSTAYFTLTVSKVNTENYNTEQSAYCLVKLDLATGACSLVEQNENGLVLLGVLGNSLLVMEYQGGRTAMWEDPNDPNATFYQIASVPLDGSPKTVHRTAPHRSETFAYDEPTHSLYFSSYGLAREGNDIMFHSDGILYQLDLLTDTITQKAQLPSASPTNVGRSVNMDFVDEGYLLMLQFLPDVEEARYRVRLSDGETTMLKNVSPRTNAVFTDPPAQCGPENYLVTEYGMAYLIPKADFWQGKQNYTPQKGLWEILAGV